MESLLIHLRPMWDLFKLAMQCLAAQWLGIGKVEDYCGSCIYCAMVRYATLCLGFLVVFIISKMLAILIGVAWVVYSAMTGKGWAGAYLYEAKEALLDKYVRPPKG